MCLRGMRRGADSRRTSRYEQIAALQLEYSLVERGIEDEFVRARNRSWNGDNGLESARKRIAQRQIQTNRGEVRKDSALDDSKL